MRKHFRLNFETKKGSFSLQLTIVKSFGERVHLKQGYNNQPVRWIKVTLKDPDLKKITSRKDIDHIVQANELEHIYPTGEEDDEGNPTYVKIDKESLKDAFPSSDEMTVLKTVKLSSIPLYYMQDAHYFLNVRLEKGGKEKKPNKDDIRLYSLVYEGLKANEEALLVKYNSMNTIKYGVIYTGKKGLMLSNIIPTNFQKKREDEQKIVDVKLKAFDVLVGNTRNKESGSVSSANSGSVSSAKWKFEDEYGLLLEELIKATLRGEKVEKKKVKPKSYSKLDSLFDDEEEEEEDRPKRKQSSSRSRSSGSGKKKIKNAGKNEDDE